MKVFLDTNVLVSAFTTRGLSADVLRLVLAEHEILTGEVNLVELRRGLERKMRSPDSVVREIEALLREHGVVAKPKTPAKVPTRDPADRWVLASALRGGADVLVTGDKDLLTLAGKVSLLILDPRGFWELHRRWGSTS